MGDIALEDVPNANHGMTGYQQTYPHNPQLRSCAKKSLLWDKQEKI